MKSTTRRTFLSMTAAATAALALPGASSGVPLPLPSYKRERLFAGLFVGKFEQFLMANGVPAYLAPTFVPRVKGVESYDGLGRYSYHFETIHGPHWVSSPHQLLDHEVLYQVSQTAKIALDHSNAIEALKMWVPTVSIPASHVFQDSLLHLTLASSSIEGRIFLHPEDLLTLYGAPGYTPETNALDRQKGWRGVLKSRRRATGVFNSFPTKDRVLGASHTVPKGHIKFVPLEADRRALKAAKAHPLPWHLSESRWVEEHYYAPLTCV